MNKEDNYKLKYQNLNISYFLGCFFLIVSILLFSNSNCFAQTHEISEIFIEATGNNKHEAKIKAHEQGMLRSLLLLTNKLNLPTDNISQIPYYKLKSVFKPILVQNEISLVEKYSATVTYSYDKEKLYQLILEYGDTKINDQFYEFVVIPVFKQRKTMNIWEDDKRWNDHWSKSRKVMGSHKIFYPTKNLYLTKKITQENLFDLKLEEFVNIFHNVLFKNVMIITAEFFTNRKTSESVMQVKKYILRPNSLKPEVIEEEYSLNRLEDIPHTVDTIIDKMIDDYGVIRDNLPDDQTKQGEDQVEDEEAKKPIIMNFDMFDKDELSLVISKLEKVDEIERFAIEHDYNTRYKILIYTSADEYQLAEGLYLRGLSYKIHGDLYNLIDIKKGS